MAQLREALPHGRTDLHRGALPPQGQAAPQGQEPAQELEGQDVLPSDPEPSGQLGRDLGNAASRYERGELVAEPRQDPEDGHQSDVGGQAAGALSRPGEEAPEQLPRHGYAQPIGISDYQLSKAVPENLKSALPSIEEVEEELTLFLDKDKNP